MAAIDTLLATWIWGGSLAKPYQDRKRPEGVVGAAVCLGHTVNLKANNNNKVRGTVTGPGLVPRVGSGMQGAGICGEQVPSQGMVYFR